MSDYVDSSDKTKRIPLSKILPKIKSDKIGPKKYIIAFAITSGIVLIVVIIYVLLIKRQTKKHTCPEGMIITMDQKGCTRRFVSEQYDAIISKQFICPNEFVVYGKTAKCIKDFDTLTLKDPIGCSVKTDTFIKRLTENACLEKCLPGYSGKKVEDDKNLKEVKYICVFDKKFCDNDSLFKGSDPKDPNTCLFK